MANNVGDVIALKRRAVSASGIAFTGKNGKDVVNFIKEFGGDHNEIRNGGSYVKVATDDGRLIKARKGDWVVVDADASVHVLNDDQFTLFFLVKA